MKFSHIILIVLFLMALSQSALAACVAPAGNEGNQMYNVTSNKMQYCNGTDWIDMSGGPSGNSEPGDEMGNHTALQNLNMTTHKIIDMGTPTSPQDIVTKAYVDSLTGTNETDPQIGAVTNNNWCKGDGSAAQCNIAALGTSANIVFVQEIYHAALAGGAANSTLGAWTTKNLNHLTYSNLTGASLANNRITLPAGTYYIDAVMPFYLSNEIATRLVRVSDGAILVNGGSAWSGVDPAGSDVQTSSFVRGNFTLTSSDSVEIQYFILSDVAAAAQGQRVNFHSGAWNLGYEVYASAYIMKVASDGSCFQDDINVQNGASYSFYNATSCATAATLSRTCTNGTLGGNASYQYGLCSSPTITFQSAVAGQNSLTGVAVNLPIGMPAADRLVIAVATGQIDSATRTISSMSIGGVAATIAVQRNNGTGGVVAIAYRLVPAGMTADIEAQYSGTIDRWSLNVYSLTGQTSNTPHATTSQVGTGALSMSATFPAYSAVIGAAYSRNGTSWGWTNLGVNNDFSVGANRMSVASQNYATAQTGLNIVATPASGTLQESVLAVWK